MGSTEELSAESAVSYRPRTGVVVFGEMSNGLANGCREDMDDYESALQAEELLCG